MLNKPPSQADSRMCLIYFWGVRNNTRVSWETNSARTENLGSPNVALAQVYHFARPIVAWQYFRLLAGYYFASASKFCFARSKTLVEDLDIGLIPSLDVLWESPPRYDTETTEGKAS